MSDQINPYNAGTLSPTGSPFAPSAGEVSEIVYELEVEDLVELAIYNQKRSRTMRRQHLLARASIAVLVAGAICLTLLEGKGLAVAIAAFLITFAFFNLLPFLARRRMRRLLRKMFLEGSNRTLLGTRRLAFTPQGMRFSSELIESTVKWPAVESIESNDEYAYLYLAAVQAHIVPRRAFNDPAQFLAFVELARRYWRQATGRAVA